MAKDKNQGQSFLPDLVKSQSVGPARDIRDAINFAEFPLAIFGSRQNTKGVYEATIYRDGSGLEITVSGNKDKGIEIFYGWDLDYSYGLISMLHDEHRVGPRELLFPFEHWIERANHTATGPEYRMANRFLEKARHVVISKSCPVVDSKGEMKLVKEVFPPIVEYYAIVGGLRKRGRKRFLDETKTGYCWVVFSEWAINHLLHEELSTPLNFDFMMKIPTPLGRRYFRLINCIRNRGGADEITRHLQDVAARIPLSDRNPSHIKRNLDPTHEELKKLNYLKGVEYGSDGRIPLITWRFSKFGVDQALAIQELVSRGVAFQKASEFAGAKPVKFILDVTRLFDFLKKGKEVSSAGWIVKIIETAEPSSIDLSLEKYKEETRKRRASLEVRQKVSLLDHYTREIQDKVAEAKNKLTPSEMAGYEARAMANVHKNSACLGDWAYKLSLESAVDDLIRNDLKIPSFEEWCDQRRREGLP